MTSKTDKIESRSNVAKHRARLRLNMLAGFREIPEVNIPFIPKERTKFPGSENDYWYELRFPNNDNITACVYEFGEGSIFPPHFHEDSCEQFILMSKDAVFEVVTEDSEYEVRFPNSCFFPKGTKHAVINKSGKSVRAIVVWKPRMNGWDAEFLNQKE